MSMIKVEIEGNILMQLEKYSSLLSVIYMYSSDEIATLLKATLQNKKVTNQAQRNLLFQLSEAFLELKETPAIILEKE